VVSKIFFPINGGLGDAYKGYWSYLPYGKLGALKEKYPNCKVKFIVCSHNPQTAEFFKYHPYIDEVEVHPAVRRDPGDAPPGKIIEAKYGKGYTPASSLLREFKDLPYIEPAVYLKNQKERDFVEDIASRGKYICIHPFAGGVVRNVPKIKTYYKIALKINNKLDCNVVILGGSYERATERETRFTKEAFPYASSRIINLMDKTNARTAAQIVRSGAGFVGTWSCFLCAILKTDMRSVTYIPAGRPALTSGSTYKYLSKEIKPIFIGKKTDMTLVKNSTINWFKEHI
jgi:hypothetical protein